MALGSTAKTHTKRRETYARSAKSLAIKASRAANKGACKSAIHHLVSAAAYAGMRVAEGEGAVKRKRKALGGKAIGKAFKGFNKTYAKVISKCAHKA